ncbi:MAG: TIR domain-containing protein [Alphaproteobacteria bacterium]|nr:TIR domain-containing protein [Alphaproteobacteria bacterium]
MSDTGDQSPTEINDQPEPQTILRLHGQPLSESHHLARYLGVPNYRMTRTLYNENEGARYRHFEIPKRTGGMRQIHAPVGLVRELQDKLLPDFKALYRAHPNAHGFIDGRSVTSNAADHTGKRWVLNVDLKDFFPSINFGRIRGLLMKPPFDMGPAAASVCAQIVTYRNGLPQGAPTSPILSNFIAATLDRRLLRLARQNRLTYSRYADDITLSTNLAQFPPSIAVREPISGGGFKVSIGDALEQAIILSGFQVNERKVRIQGHHFHQSVTGLCVNERVNIERKRIRKLRAMLHAWRKFGIDSAGYEHFHKYRGSRRNSPPDNPAASFRNIVYGNLSFIKMVRGPDDPLFLKLCSQVLELDPNPSKFLRQMVFGADDYEVFISHASEDKAAIARPVFEACNRLGIKAFLDEEHIGFGQSFTSKINTALGASRTVLAIITPNSVTKEWPLEEVNTALALEVSGNKRVIALMVGNPDLTRLPLIRTKRWIEWTGNADQVAAELKAQVQPPEPTASVPEIHATVDRAAAITSAGSTIPDAASAWQSTPPPPKRGWLSRIFGRR